MCVKEVKFAQLSSIDRLTGEIAMTTEVMTRPDLFDKV